MGLHNYNLKFYKKLKSAAGTVADAVASDIGISIIESAVNEIDKSHVASKFHCTQPPLSG